MKQQAALALNVTQKAFVFPEEVLRQACGIPSNPPAPLLPSRCGEVYVINALDASPEARLTRSIACGQDIPPLPKGLILRMEDERLVFLLPERPAKVFRSIGEWDQAH
jgi:hypothetical protein